MARVQDPGSGLSPQQVAALYKGGQSINYIASQNGLSPAEVTALLQQAGISNPSQNAYSNTPVASGRSTQGPGGTTFNAGIPTATGPDERNQAQATLGVQNPGTAPGTNPNGPPPPGFSSWAQYNQYLQQLQSAASGGGSAASSAAADLAEKKREFDITTQRDISKENATEVDALQKMLAGLSGPKDVYADLFFSHGLNVPQGYAPAPVPLTDAQKSAYQGMGVSPQQLQQMIIGTGQPGADTGYLGNLGSSLQPQPGQPGFTAAQAPVGPLVASNPTAQGGALYGRAPAGTTVAGPAAPTPAMAGGGEVPGQIGDPRLIVAHGGEQVDNNTPQGPIAPMNNGSVHPAIQKLMDALSELLANPDFQQFAGVAGKAAAISKGPTKGGKGKAPKEGSPAEEASESPLQEAAEQAGPSAGPMAGMMPPGPTVTPGGMQAMATGGTVTSPSQSPVTSSGTTTSTPSLPTQAPSLSPRPPIQPSPVPSQAPPAYSPPSTTPVGANPKGRGISTPAAGLPLAGAQGVQFNTGVAQPADNPILALDKMDPYTRALYDVHGRLHPYSAQQLAQMGPQGQQAVESYVGKVEGADVNAYTDLAKRLMPLGAAPTASTGTASEGFSFG